jgi:hypothetical protein
MKRFAIKGILPPQNFARAESLGKQFAERGITFAAS